MKQSEEEKTQFFGSFTFDESISVVFYGQREALLRQICFYISVFCTLGLTGLLALWSPRFRAWATMKSCRFPRASHVLVITCHKKTELVRIQDMEIYLPVEGLFESPKASPKQSLNHDLIRFFEYQYSRFLLNPFSGKFVCSSQFPDLKPGNLGQEICIERQRIIYGLNTISVRAKTILELFLFQITRPFFIFQMLCVLIWWCEEYKLYAICIFLITIQSLVSTIYEVKGNSEKLKKISKINQPVSILRNSQWVPGSSEDLVPGDRFSLDPSLTQIPCDAILISGDVIVDESMLTGETTPVIKGAVEAHLLATKSASQLFGNPKFGLFAGTRLVTSRSTGIESPLALVYRTGFLTQKGSLIQSLMFPRPDTFQFHKDATIFIGIMAVIALVVFSISLVNLTMMEVSLYYILTRALDLITVVLPPALPATLSVGVAASLKRLKKEKILCFNPAKINVASKVDRICFDKTGTLTEEGLKIHHVVSFAEESGVERILEKRPCDQELLLKENSILHLLMSTCHSLRQFAGRLIGDPLEIEMFGFTGTSFAQLSERREFIIERRTWKVRREYEFNPEIRRMSVVVSSNESFVLTKGSPECMKNICRQDSLPQNFDTLLEAYASNGYRVLACAARSIEWEQWSAEKLSRAQIEKHMVFLGFIVFENKLKPSTLPVLEELNSACLKVAMVTGDNLLTAISVSRAAKIIRHDEPVFMPTAYGTDFMYLSAVDTQTGGKLEIQLQNLGPVKISLACIGEQFDLIMNSLNPGLAKIFLENCYIFARMSPMQKKRLVEKFQQIGECICFCGDGANDCAALMAADVGVSLSQAEASVAAPFTSNACDISSVLVLLKNGRSSLVTSFVSFKFMAMYSIIQFTTLSFLYTFGSAISDWQFIYMDLLLILPFGVLINKYAPSDMLSTRKPSAKLISSPVLVSLFLQMILQALFQGLVFIETRRRFGPSAFLDGPNVENIEATSLAMFSVFLYLTQGLIFSEGKPHRQSFNASLYVYAGIIAVGNCVLLLGRISWIDWLMQFVDVPWSHRLFLLGITAAYMITSYSANLLCIRIFKK